MTTGQGLRDVVAADTSITWIDGESGQLRYRGYPISDLAEHSTFEEIAYLLWHGELPSSSDLNALRRELRSIRMQRTDVLEAMEEIPLLAHPLDVLRYIVSWDALRNPLTGDNSADANLRKSTELMAWFPVVVAAYHRLAAGDRPVLPLPDADTAANLLYMLRGRQADEVSIRTVDTSLILHADHELNASTFAARVTIATQSNLHAAIASALGTLSGPLHGGASDRVIHMLEAIGTPDQTETWVMDQLRRRERIMGFGHAVYQTTDPRARHLRDMAQELVAGTDHAQWIDILDRVALILERERGRYPNVDLYAAVVNHELGVRPAFYSSIFACSRVAGWTAHAVEQLGGRLIRPSANYVGPDLRRITERSPATISA